MFNLTTLILVGMIAFVFGLFAGGAVTRFLMPREQQNRALEDRLRKSEQTLREYQSQVSDHFAETSQRVNNLTRTYKEMHEFLTSSALQLTNPEIGRAFLNNAPTNSDIEDKEPTETLEAPRDWAPNKGTLSESFGLKDDAPEVNDITPASTLASKA